MSARFHPYLCGRNAAEWLIDMKVRKKQLTRQQRLALLPVISLIGIALIALGIVQNRRMNESMPVEAEITGYREVSSENIMGENGKTTAYYAEYRYIVDGEEYTAVSDRASATAPVIGERETIYVSSLDEGSVVLSGSTYVIVGGVFTVFALVFFMIERFVPKTTQKTALPSKKAK